MAFVSGSLQEITRYLECAVSVLDEALKPVLSKLTQVKTNRVQYDALAKEYQAGMAKISTFVQVLLQLLKAASSSQHHIGVLKSLSLLLFSLAEIERCMHSSAVYTSTGAVQEVVRTELLDVDNARCLSTAAILMFRDFSFCLDLVEVTFNRFIFELNILHTSENPVGQVFRKEIAEEFCTSEPLNLFEWCGRSCRRVLKQCFWGLGQQVVQQVLEVVKEAAHHEDIGNLCEELKEAKTDPARLSPRILQILEEPGAEPRHSLPARINYVDVHQGKFLGQGSYGSVLQCKWQDKDMVVKFIKMDPEEPKVQEKFEMEVSILSSLKHPNAVQTSGFGYTEKNGEGFIMMEQMEADLNSIIIERRKGGELPVFPIDVCISTMLQIVEAMCSLREKRVIHRDLKPANILVNRADKGRRPYEYERFLQVKLADFGTSKVNDVNSRFSTMKTGTPIYMAPEVNSAIADEAEHPTCTGYSWEADVYSFGMVCAEIISGERPFQHLNPVNCRTVLAAVRKGDMPIVALDCEDPLRRLIEDCWKFKPAARPNVWEVRQRLWECRVHHFFEMKRPPTSWRPFRTNLLEYSRLCIECPTLPMEEHITTRIPMALSAVGCHKEYGKLTEDHKTIQPGVTIQPSGENTDLEKLQYYDPNATQELKMDECNTEFIVDHGTSTNSSSQALESMHPSHGDQGGNHTASAIIVIAPVFGVANLLIELITSLLESAGMAERCQYECRKLEVDIRSILPGVQHVRDQLQELPFYKPQAQQELKMVGNWLEKLSEEIYLASIQVHRCNTTSNIGVEIFDNQLSKNITAHNANIMKLAQEQVVLSSNQHAEHGEIQVL